MLDSTIILNEVRMPILAHLLAASLPCTSLSMSVARNVPAKSMLPKVISMPNAFTMMTTSMFAAMVRKAVRPYNPVLPKTRYHSSTEPKVSSNVTMIRISFMRYTSSFGSLVFWHRLYNFHCPSDSRLKTMNAPHEL